MNNDFEGFQLFAIRQYVDWWIGPIKQFPFGDEIMILHNITPNTIPDDYCNALTRYFEI